MATRSYGSAAAPRSQSLGQVADPLADLVTLSVLPEFRGAGIGSALMDAVEARLGDMGIGDMAITVIATNLEASLFYERRGATSFVTEFIQEIKPAAG